MDIQTWQTFSLPGFALQFRYPRTTPNGHDVEMDEMRAHFRSQGSEEAYFEISRHVHTTARAVYDRERGFVTDQLAGGEVSTLQPGTIAGQPAHEFRIRWEGGERVVILLEHQEYVYRFVYDPRSEVNRHVLATMDLLGDG
jgi:hypothetical protein